MATNFQALATVIFPVLVIIFNKTSAAPVPEDVTAGEIEVDRGLHRSGGVENVHGDDRGGVDVGLYGNGGDGGSGRELEGNVDGDAVGDGGGEIESNGDGKTGVGIRAGGQVREVSDDVEDPEGISVWRRRRRWLCWARWIWLKLTT